MTRALAALLFLPAAAAAQLPPPQTAPTRDIRECRALKGKPGELECYQNLPAPTEPGAIASEWHLRERNLATAQLVAYRPTYAIVRATDNVNQRPTGVAADQGFDSAEMKLQVSFRGELVSPEQFSRLGGDRLRLWYAYTQQSNWQAFNTENSRPFRDTNYEPELILTYNAETYGAADWPRPALLNLGVVHQSNGRSAPESRTWWRTYLQSGWQLRQGSLLARIWRTWKEEGLEADNPDINQFIGRGDLVFRSREHARYGGFNLLVRSNLRAGRHRGYAQLDWRTPWKPLNIPWHVQVSHGYGESLLDYNHKQTTLGFGFSFWDW